APAEVVAGFVLLGIFLVLPSNAFNVGNAGERILYPGLLLCLLAFEKNYFSWLSAVSKGIFGMVAIVLLVSVGRLAFHTRAEARGIGGPDRDARGSGHVSSEGNRP